MPCYEIDGVVPVVHPTAYVHPTAVLIGDVHVGENCYIGPCASLRADFGRIIIKKGANIQDTCVIHAFPGKATVVEVNGHVGHGAVLHGCIIGEDSLVGMNSVIMDNAVIGKRSIVAAMSFVKAGFEGEEESLIMGAPAKKIRSLDANEISWKKVGTEEYQELTLRCMQTMKECEPLIEIEENRPVLQMGKNTLKNEWTKS